MKFILELNIINWLNIGRFSFHFFLFGFFFRALLLQSMRLLSISSCNLSQWDSKCFSRLLEWQWVSRCLFSFFSLHVCYCWLFLKKINRLLHDLFFLYISYVIIACDLDQIIKLPDFIGNNQVNGLRIKFFISLKILSSYEHFLNIKKSRPAREVAHITHLIIF